MTLFTIPLRYARVKWLRTLLLTAVFTLGVASMTGLHHISTLVGDSFEKKLLSYGANVLIVPKQETLTIRYGGYTLGDVALTEQSIPLAGTHASINAIPLRGNLAVVAPKMLGVTRVSGQPVALVGVDWKAELALKGYWEVEGQLPTAGRVDEALVGADLARKLGLHPGQTLVVGGGEVRISGILKPTGSDDDTVIFAALPFVQDFTGRYDQAAFFEVAALCSGCPIDDIVTQLQHALPGTEVKALRQVAESRMYSVHFAQNLAFYVSVVILVTACAMIIMSVLSAVTERRKEIGIMRAIGFSRACVFVVFTSEALGVGVLSGVIGHVAGYILAGKVLEQLHLADTAIRHFDFSLFFITIAVTGLIAGAAAAFPAWKATLVDPAEALVSL